MHKALLAIASIAFPLAATAQDMCRDILTNGFYNEFAKTADNAKDEAMYADLCSSNFSQAQASIKRAQQSGGGGSVGVSYGLFSLSGGQSNASGDSFSQEQFNQWKSKYCTKNTAANSSRSAEFLIQKTVAGSVVSAWTDCMRSQEGLTCWAQPYQNEILVNVNWKKTSLSQPKVLSSYISAGASSHLDGASQGKLFPDNFYLNPGLLQVPVTRMQEGNVIMNFNATHDGVSYSCGVFVPGIKDYALLEGANSTKSPRIGCEAKAAPFGINCSGSWAYQAPANQRVCTVVFAASSGPTSGAELTLNGNASGGTIRWRVQRDDTPFGAGRWVFGTATVTFVSSSKASLDDGTVCNAGTLIR